MRPSLGSLEGIHCQTLGLVVCNLRNVSVANLSSLLTADAACRLMESSQRLSDKRMSRQSLDSDSGIADSAPRPAR